MQKNKALFLINISVLMFGLAGLFAKWISLSSIEIAFGRVLISSLTLLLFSLATKRPLRISDKKHLWMLMAAGVVLAVHWAAFFGSIRLSTVAVGTITFSSFPLFVTFLEPLFFKEKLCAKNVLTAVLTLLGVLITIPQFSLENRMSLGIAVGMLSAFSYAVMTLLNRYLSGHYESVTVVLYEQGTAAAVLLPCIFIKSTTPAAKDIGLLLFLGIVTTAFAHTLFTKSLKHLSAQVAGVVSSLESVYGILFALLFLGEVPTLRECLGACIVIGAAVYAQRR